MTLSMNYSISSIQTFLLTNLIRRRNKSIWSIGQKINRISISKLFRNIVALWHWLLNNSFSRLIIAVKLVCRSTFYGSRCSKQCIPNDDCSSSYSCHPITGDKICSPGWYGDDCSLRNSSLSSCHCENGGFCLDNRTNCCCPKGKHSIISTITQSLIMGSFFHQYRRLFWPILPISFNVCTWSNLFEWRIVSFKLWYNFTNVLLSM